MSRRNNSSRRRNYGRRQHEVRERRPSPLARSDWHVNGTPEDWSGSEANDERPRGGSADARGGAQQ
jgi:hypothetical protein